MSSKQKSDLRKTSSSIFVLHVLTDFNEFFISDPNIVLNENHLRVPSGIGLKEYKPSYNSIKSVDIITDPEKLERLLRERIKEQSSSS